MAFISTISACLNGCNRITITDTTGFYNSTTNPFGWNNDLTVWRTNVDSPNIVEAKLSISLNGGAPIVIDVLTTIQAAVFPIFELYEYFPLDNADNSTLQDGYYNITYTITDSTDEVYQTEIQFVVYCNVACCVSKLAARVADELCNNCDSEAYNDFLIADGMLQALKAVAESKGTQEINKLLNKLQKLCNQTSAGGCGCGCS